MRSIKRDEQARVQFTLNGQPVSAYAEPRLLLTDFLRHQLGATGTHVGCEHGVCGCCTVIVDGVATRACLMLAVQVEGREVRTVESLAGPELQLDPLQRAFREHHALQCGFCTPGILMSFTDYLGREGADASPEAVRDVLGGHICRCTGYHGIVEAIVETAKKDPAP
jgi:2-furoyl-CoA dehydrogenase 2Fe-2S iron sulfur subunit